MPKNIWYISKYANIKKYGASTRHAFFCEEFSSQGHNVKLVTSNSSHLHDNLPSFKGRYLRESFSGGEVVWVNTIKYKNATSIARFLSWIWFEFFVIWFSLVNKDEKPDVVIVSSLSILSIVSGCVFKLFYRSRFILEIRDIWPQSLIDLKGLSSFHPLVLLLKLIEKTGYKYADAIVGTMPGLHLHVESIIGSSDKVFFIPQGVNLEFLDKEQMAIPDEYIEKYLPKNKFVVIYAGTYGIAYALEHVIDAAKILLNQNSNIHFVFVGGGLEEKNLREQASHLTNITFAPRVKKEQVLSVLAKADLLLHSFKMKKVFEFGISPNKFIDYMAAKKPIICMFSGFPSLINEANCGAFIPSENALVLAETLKKYSELPKQVLEELGYNGYQFLVKNMNYKTLSKQYLDIIET